MLTDEILNPCLITSRDFMKPGAETYPIGIRMTVPMEMPEEEALEVLRAFVTGTGMGDALAHIRRGRKTLLPIPNELRND